MRILLRKSFKLVNETGQETAIKGVKERALLALLVVSPDQSFARKDLQAMLWSERFPDQQSASLRRALANLRKALAGTSLELLADRRAIKLVGSFELVWGVPEDGALLEDLHVKDRGFQSWVQKLRFETDGTIPRLGAPDLLGTQNERIVLRVDLRDAAPELRFLTRTLTDAFAEHLKSQGPIDILVLEHGDDPPLDRVPVLWVIDISSVIVGQRWQVHVSAARDQPRRHLWSGRMQLPFDIDRILEGFDLVDFVGRAAAAIQASDRSAQGVYVNLLAASQKVFLGDRDELELADRILAGLEVEDPDGIAGAWRAFVSLTRILEHGERQEDDAESAISFSTNLERRGTMNALTAALSSQVAMKVARDADRGAHLAHRALEYSEANPYALHAMSQASVLRGDFLSGYKFAQNGRKASARLPNSFCWDMQACLAALGIGKRAEAYDLARNAHAKMPTYRPALRYLAALSLLSGDHQQAHHWCQRLAALEPGFRPGLLLSADYPLDTFRQLGLQDQLASVWQP